MSLQETRQEVAAGLNEVGLNVKDHVPAKVAPPIVILGYGDPMLEEGETYDQTEFVVHMELFAIAGTATNETALSKLEDMVETILFNLGDWNIDAVSAPYMGSANDAVYLTSRISITKTITINGGTE